MASTRDRVRSLLNLRNTGAATTCHVILVYDQICNVSAAGVEVLDSEVNRMTPVNAALLVAFIAGTLASVAAGYINRGIARVMRRRKMRTRRPDDNEESS